MVFIEAKALRGKLTSLVKSIIRTKIKCYTIYLHRVLTDLKKRAKRDVSIYIYISPLEMQLFCTMHMCSLYHTHIWYTYTVHVWYNHLYRVRMVHAICIQLYHMHIADIADGSLLSQDSTCNLSQNYVYNFAWPMFGPRNVC